MKNKLNIPVLVLNKSWTPFQCTTVEKAIGDLSIGKVTAIDNESYFAYPWEDPTGNGMGWFDLPVIGDMLYLQMTRDRKVRIPRVIVTQEYNKIPNFEVKYSPKNVWLRDGGRCQYSGDKLPFSEMTLDHVIPKSRGGVDDWHNVVTCRGDLNRKKADKTPAEMGWTLLSKPYKPKWTPLYSAVFSNPEMPEEFKPWIKVRDSHANLYAAMRD